MSLSFEDIMRNGVLDGLTADQLDELILKAQAIRSENQNGTEVEVTKSCPGCGSIKIKKHGTTSKGNTRMICRDCGKTWTISDNPDTRLTNSQITSLVTGLIENLTLSQLAARMDVSESTAHRHKLQVGDILYQRVAEELNAVDENGKPTFKFEGVAQCDGWYCRLSFKGKRNPEFFIYTLKRFPRHNMTKADQEEYLKKYGLWEQVQAIPGYFDKLRENTVKRESGISNDLACVIVAVDEERKIMAKPATLGRITNQDAAKLLGGRFTGSTTLVTDSHSAYVSLAKKDKLRHVKIESGKHSNGTFNLGRVNGIHIEIENMLIEKPHRIPATKYLNQYMAIFIWNWMHKGQSLEEKTYLLKKTIKESQKYKESYEKIKVRPLDINTKGRFAPQV